MRTSKRRSYIISTPAIWFAIGRQIFNTDDIVMSQLKRETAKQQRARAPRGECLVRVSRAPSPGFVLEFLVWPTLVVNWPEELKK
jgi:hypothetical protein